MASIESLSVATSGYMFLACRAIKELHRETADELNVDHETRAEVERLLGELQQLLAGIAIMQVSPSAPEKACLCLLFSSTHEILECGSYDPVKRFDPVK